MREVLLMGNPNVGKSVLFSRLTGVHVLSSNYPGTTVEFFQGYTMVGGQRATLIDVPGTYGLEATCKAEEIATELLGGGDVVVNVVDATNLERNLHLTLHLQEQNIPMVVALNLWDEARHQGIHIDVDKLAGLLGVAVIPTVGVTGEGIKELVAAIPDAANPTVAERTEEERWTEVGRIVDQVQNIEHRHHTLLERLGDLSVMPVWGLTIAAFVLIAAFGVIRFIGESLIGFVLEPAFETFWRPLMVQLSRVLQPFDFFHAVFIGELIEGQIDFQQSFGVLTTGLFVALGMVLPYVVAFYLILGFLEDFGYLPRLAVLLDRLMHRMGLHGWAIIPMLLGFGCNVSGVMATRMLENYRERMIAATLVCIAVPCASLQAMIFGLLGSYGARYVIIVYATLFIVWIITGRAMNLMLKGGSPELILDIPPYRLPSWRHVGKKLWMRMRVFFREAIPVVLIGILIVNVLNYIHVFDAIASLTAPVMVHVLGLPKESIIALVIGFFRKDVAVGMLSAQGLTPKQLVVAVVVLTMSFPCIATFIVLIKELGIRRFWVSFSVMIVAALAVGGLLNLVL